MGNITSADNMVIKLSLFFYHLSASSFPPLIPFITLREFSTVRRGRPDADAEGGIDIIPLDAAMKSLPLGFVYGWWQAICTITGSVVGSGLQMTGIWRTA